MAKNQIIQYTRFSGGISDFRRESLIPDAFYFARSIDTRTDPQNIKLLPRTIKESGTIVTDLVKWGETIPTSFNTFMYGSTGNFYKRTNTRSYSLLRAVSNSHGNGMVYFPEEDYIYYASDKVVGRYGPMFSASPQLVDDYFGSTGGIPLNTNSLDLESGSSQYADRADTASLSITGNLAISTQIKPESLPTVGNTMTLVAKWTESGNARSYKFDIAAVSGYFGDSSDGVLTISSNTTEAPIDSACTATSGSMSISATNVSFASGQVILIHQTRGVGAGTWQRNTISGYTAGTITTTEALNADYVSGAQVLVMKQYSSVTVNTGVTYTAKAWDGTVGGILAFIVSGTLTRTGNISADSCGFRGGTAGSANAAGNYGEGTAGASAAATTPSANGNGGGSSPGNQNGDRGGGGGGNGAVGSDGTANDGTPGQKGSAAGTTDLTTMVFGGGGGAGQSDDSSAGNGGDGGGIVFLSASTITGGGLVTSNGDAGVASGQAGGGGGAGGSILLKAQTATLGTNLVTASGGTGGVPGLPGSTNGGDGAVGRIHLDYYTSYTGTTTPTIDATQDNSLVTNTTYQLRLAVSSTGTNSETLAQTASLTVGSWQQVGVSWVASTSTATFFLNAVSLGSRVGALTAISNNASRFGIGKYINGAAADAAFYDGLIDEVQVYNMTRSESDFLSSISTQIPAATTPGLQAYYKLNGDYTDATANANDLTASGAPVFSSDVPFPSPTTRLDIDQTATGTGNTYSLASTLSEAAASKLSFTPTKDPQKSISVNVANKGTGSWTVYIHDSNNIQVATVTVTNANMTTGNYEFVYASVFRTAPGMTYHAHFVSSDASGTINTLTASTLVGAGFTTYFQFLVNDVDYHPMARFLTGWVIGNERYLGRYDATLYEPNLIDFGAGLRVRCLAYWREYIAVGMWRGTSITDYDQGRIYFWDGIAPTFNFYIDVPEGGINAMLGTKGKLFIFAGYQGDLLEYIGGDTATKVKRMPKVENDTYMEVLPGSITMWKTLLRAGIALNSDSNDIQRGGYTYGKTNERYVDALTFDYPTSTGNYGSTVSIGWMGVSQQELLMAWQDNVSYGVDYVNSENAPFPSGTMEFLVDDSDAIWKQKELMSLAANFDPLNSGESISLKYKLDSDSNWTANLLETSTSDTVSRFVVTAPKRYNQLEAAIDLATTVSTSPTVSGVAVEVNLLSEEDRVG